MKSVPRPVLIVTLLCFVLAPILLLNLVEFLRGGELWNWLWPYKPVWLPDADRGIPEQTGRALILAASVVVYLAAAWWAVRHKTARYALLVAFVGSVILPYLVTWLRYDNPFIELFERTVSGVVTGPHLLASQINWQNPDEWHDWVKVMDDYHILSVHMGQSPPGLVLFYGGLNQLLEWLSPVADFLYERLLPHQCYNSNMLNYTHAEWASTWFGILMPLWAALTIFPLYRLAKRLTGEMSARWIALSWILIPAVAMMSPSWNLIYPVFCLLAFWLLLAGMDKQRGELHFIASGFITGLVVFANLSVVPVILLFGFYTLLHYIVHERHQYPFYRPIITGLWFGSGTISVPLLFMLATGTTPLAILQRAFGTHLELDRPYLPWLWMHAWEWALLGSLPCVGLFLVAVFNWSRGLFGKGKIAWRSTGSVLPVALFLTLLVMLLSDTARGETGRVWLFFTPFAMLSAALAGPPFRLSAAQPAEPGTQNLELTTQHFYIWFPVMLAQAALMLALALTWDTMYAPDMKPPPLPPPPYANAIPQNALFGDAFRLVGWYGESDGRTLTLYLNMQSTRQLTIPYFFAALPVGPDGTVGPGFVWQPNATRYPTTCWQPDQVVGDVVPIPLPENAAPGDWWISLTAFADENNPMDTLTVTLTNGTTDRQIGLGPVRVGE